MSRSDQGVCQAEGASEPPLAAARAGAGCQFGERPRHPGTGLWGGRVSGGWRGRGAERKVTPAPISGRHSTAERPTGGRLPHTALPCGAPREAGRTQPEKGPLTAEVLLTDPGATERHGVWKEASGRGVHLGAASRAPRPAGWDGGLQTLHIQALHVAEFSVLWREGRSPRGPPRRALLLP